MEVISVTYDVTGPLGDGKMEACVDLEMLDTLANSLLDPLGDRYIPGSVKDCRVKREVRKSE